MGIPGKETPKAPTHFCTFRCFNMDILVYIKFVEDHSTRGFEILDKYFYKYADFCKSDFTKIDFSKGVHKFWMNLETKLSNHVPENIEMAHRYGRESSSLFDSNAINLAS